MRSTGRVFVVAIGPLPSIGDAERVDDAAEERVADGHLDDAAGGADFVAFFDVVVVAEDDDADGLLFEVEREAHDAVRELDQLGRMHVRQAVDAGDAVAGLDDGADVDALHVGAELLDLLLDDAAISSDRIAIVYLLVVARTGQASVRPRVLSRGQSVACPLRALSALLSHRAFEAALQRHRRDACCHRSAGRRCGRRRRR